MLPHHQPAEQADHGRAGCVLLLVVDDDRATVTQPGQGDIAGR